MITIAILYFIFGGLFGATVTIAIYDAIERRQRRAAFYKRMEETS
jgi:hypothetical protein